jgi:hypothetical protein
MNSEELFRLGKLYIGKHFLNVYPLDELPPHLNNGESFIVNTHTHTLPGKHWIAVYATTFGETRVYDPLGVHYPSHLVNYLQARGKHVLYNREMHQHPSSNLCGIYCILFLIGQSLV